MAKGWFPASTGSWAVEAELADQEAKEREAAIYKAPGGVKEEAFPSLVESQTTTTTKSKKKKSQTLSISELMTGKYVGPGGKQRSSYTESQKLTAEEMMSLPTGPRERADDEVPSGGLGGGFKDYGGGYRAGDRGDRVGDREERRGGFGGGYGGDRDRDRGEGGYGRDRSRERDDGPSRADADDKWGAGKKFVPSLPNDRGHDRGVYEEDQSRVGRLSDRDMPSRADEVDNWGSMKKFVPAPVPTGGDAHSERRSSGRYDERRGSLGGFEDHPRGGDRDLPSRADEVDNWGKSKKFVPNTAPQNRGVGSGFDSTYREAGADADWRARKDPVARDLEQPRMSERPRLNLKPRSLPVDSPPRPSSADVNGEKAVGGGFEGEQRSSPVQKPKPRLNPFGAARPREEILAEKGQDYRKIDADLEVPRERFGRPGSSHSTRPGSSQSTRVGSRPGTPGGVSSRPQTPDVPRSRSGSIGEARPRDMNVIVERGNDSQTLNVDLERQLALESLGGGAEELAAGSE